MQKLTRDQFAKFMFAQSDKIESYNFDLMHDIKTIVTHAYDSSNFRDSEQQLITDRVVSKDWYLAVRKFGSNLFESFADADIKGYISKYKITINLNCDYFHNVEFAEITEL